MARNPVRRVLDFLAKMGLSVRDDPPKMIDLNDREWGPETHGLVLSASLTPNDDPSAVPAISVVLRNLNPEPFTFEAPSWIAFYRIDVSAPDASPVALTPYGRELLRRERDASTMAVTLQPGDMREAQVPVGAIFAMRAGVRYAVSVSCQVEGSILSANPLII